MKITYYQGKYPNFGDDLNPWMWSKLLPDFFDEDAKTLFIGVGSIISSNYDPAAKKIIFGAGFVPQYNDAPDVHNNDWNVYFVRGPRTAKALNIASDLSIGDSGILLRTLVDMKRKTGQVISFMPHWESFERGHWQRVCRLAGITLIDPRNPVEQVIDDLLRSKLVIAEAMHGAIIADAFRIPWIPVLPLDHSNRDKWHDWAEALDITLKRRRLWPSTIKEAQHVLRLRPILLVLLKLCGLWPLSAVMNTGLHYIAACRLKQLSKITPQMSDDAKINKVTEKMLEKLQQLRRDYGQAN